MGLFGSLMGSDGKTKVKNEGVTPWKDQAPYLKYGFQTAQDLFKSQQGSPSYQGDIYAGMDPLTAQAIGLVSNYSTGQGAQMANQAAGASSGVLDAGSRFGANAQGILDRSQGDRTGAILDAAGRYANNPQIDGMIDAASRDVVRNLGESVLPSLADGAIMSGNTNSTQYEVANALARRDAADRVGDISAGLRGAAFDRGLGLAQTDLQDQTNNQLNANSQLAGAFGSGIQGLQTAQGMAGTNFDALSAAGIMNQENQQGELDAQYQKWMQADQRPWDLLNNYWNIAGSGTFPSSGATAVTQPASQGILPRVKGFFS